MARHDAVGEAAFSGLVGLVLCAVGGAGASALVASLDRWLAVLPALAIWLACTYYGLKQIAHGISPLVEDASPG